MLHSFWTLICTSVNPLVTFWVTSPLSPFISIHLHSFPVFLSFISILCTLPSIGLLHSCPVPPRLLSMHQSLFISCALVLDLSRLLLTCYCFTVPMVHLNYPSHVELHPITCSLLPCSGSVQPSTFCFHLLLVVTFLFVFRQLCSLSSSPVLGSTRHCPVILFPCPSVPDLTSPATVSLLCLCQWFTLVTYLMWSSIHYHM